MRKIDKANGCWIWTAALFATGYAAFRVNGKQWRAHIWAWEQVNGTRPTRNGKPLPLDHFICSNRQCVNPEHVRPVTDRENVLRSNSLQAINRAKTHCPKDHPYDETNTYVDKQGRRSCRICMRAKRNRYR